MVEEFFPAMRPPGCVSHIAVDRPELLVPRAVVAVID
jgi:hypothetical protein